MKLWKSIVLGLIAGYVTLNVIDKISCTIWMNPMIRTFVEIKHPQEDGKHFTAQEITEKIKDTSYGYARWPYSATVDGNGTNWTLRFEPAPLTWWRRVWCAVAYWEFNPHVPSSYEMRSDTMVVECTRSDGSTYLLMENERKQTSEQGPSPYAKPEAAE